MKGVIICDSREKKNQHILKKLDKLKIPYRIEKLKYGDYSYEFNGVNYANKICVERKANINELCLNFGGGKTRFMNEFERARKEKAQVILMVEDGSWEQIEKHEYRSKFKPEELKNRICTWCYKYQIKFQFVEKKDACEFMLNVFRKYFMEVKKDE